MLRHIPNALTCLRIFLVPVFVHLHFIKMRTAALIVFVVAEITDVLDGFIARRFHCTSRLGKALDPLADKITFIGILLCLYFSDRVPAWLVLLFVAREILMIIGGIVLWNKKLTFSADHFGKFNSTLLFTAAILLFPWHSSQLLMSVGSMLLQLSLISSIVTSVHYVRRYLRLANARRAESESQPQTKSVPH